MSRKPENIFISGVHKYVPIDAPYKEKMSNPYRGGTWDVWYSGVAADIWIEYKYLPGMPQRAAVIPALSALQLKWGRDRYHEGRKLAVIIGCPKGGIILTNLHWENPVSVKAFHKALLSRDALARWIVIQTTQGHQNAASIPNKSRQDTRLGTPNTLNNRRARHARAQPGG